jgi:hypothetical protein
MDLGCIVVDELPIPIVGIKLQGGKVVVHARWIADHQRTLNSGTRSVFGPDGQLVWTSFDSDDLAKLAGTKLKPGEVLQFELALAIDNKQSRPIGRT